MFNVGSFEVLLICVIALLVLGPERLPGAVRTAGLWIGRFRRSFYKVKAEIERELNADEIRRQLHNESVMADLKKAKTGVEGVAREVEKSANKIVHTARIDTGATKHSDGQESASDAGSGAGQEPSVAAGVEATGESGEQSTQARDAIGQQLYGRGKNPKLAEGVGTADKDPVQS